ncbi:MAG TPA: hypothetical protein VEA38_09760 [Terriglobales bacterium]|nr:hypothetical protein [Terriglobales bacterium]
MAKLPRPQPVPALASTPAPRRVNLDALKRPAAILEFAGADHTLAPPTLAVHLKVAELAKQAREIEKGLKKALAGGGEVDEGATLRLREIELEMLKIVAPSIEAAALEDDQGQAVLKLWNEVFVAPTNKDAEGVVRDPTSPG